MALVTRTIGSDDIYMTLPPRISHLDVYSSYIYYDDDDDACKILSSGPRLIGK